MVIVGVSEPAVELWPMKPERDALVGAASLVIVEDVIAVLKLSRPPAMAYPLLGTVKEVEQVGVPSLQDQCPNKNQSQSSNLGWSGFRRRQTFDSNCPR